MNKKAAAITVTFLDSKSVDDVSITISGESLSETKAVLANWKQY